MCQGNWSSDVSGEWSSDVSGECASRKGLMMYYNKRSHYVLMGQGIVI